MERPFCSSLSLGGFGIGHHCVEKQGTLKETPVGSPRDAFYTFKDLYRYTTGC